MESEIEVEISNTQGHLRVDPADSNTSCRLVLAAESRPRASISIALVDNATIHAVNRTSGPRLADGCHQLPVAEPDDAVLAGELVVSAEMACTCS